MRKAPQRLAALGHVRAEGFGARAAEGRETQLEGRRFDHCDAGVVDERLSPERGEVVADRGDVVLYVGIAGLGNRFDVDCEPVQEPA